jgi:hypothetical protein
MQLSISVVLPKVGCHQALGNSPGKGNAEAQELAVFFLSRTANGCLNVVLGC